MTFFSRLSLSISQIGSFWQEKVNNQIFRWNILFIVVQIALIFFKYSELPPQIPLFYSRPWGDSQLAPLNYAYLLPVLSVGILIVNNFLAIFYLRSAELLSRLLTIISLIFSAFAALALLQVINLVS